MEAIIKIVDKKGGACQAAVIVFNLFLFVVN